MLLKLIKLNIYIYILVTIPTPAESCPRCLHQRHSRVCKLRFRFILERAPPGCPPESLVCPGCDPLWGEIGHTALSVVPNTATAGGAGATNAGAGGGAVRGGSGNMPEHIPHSHTTAGGGGSDYQAALAGKRKGRVANTTASTAKGRGSSSAGTGSGAGSASAAPKCSCGLVSKTMTVAKEGPNQGRPFHSCSKPRYLCCILKLCTCNVTALLLNMLLVEYILLLHACIYCICSII